jgi:hypothetical protein
MAMKRLGKLLAATAFLLAPIPAWAQDDQDVATANWQAIVACAERPNPENRHACVDSVLREAGVLDPEREIAAQRKSFGGTPRGDERVEQARRETASAPPPEITKLETIVANALIGGDRLLVIATTEGAVWKQIDGSAFRRAPAKGAAFSAEEGALGSYRCKIGSDIYRCQRVD